MTSKILSIGSLVNQRNSIPIFKSIIRTALFLWMIMDLVLQFQQHVTFVKLITQKYFRKWGLLSMLLAGDNLSECLV